MLISLSESESLIQAIRGLKAEGATEVHVFGSYAEGRASADSDLDLAVRGIPADRWYMALARALGEITVRVDVIDLDRPSRFAEFLMKTGRLQRVA
jgi:predicted nucleotidyltransferase